MKLTREEYMDIAYGDHPDFQLIENNVVDKRRWSVGHDVICMHKATGMFYGFGYDEPATEMQECDNPDEIELTKMRAVEKTITVYEEA